MDGNQHVAARRWCWRQSDQSAARLETQSVIVVTEAHHLDAKQAVHQAVMDLEELMEEYLGGDLVSGDLDAETPVITG